MANIDNNSNKNHNNDDYDATNDPNRNTRKQNKSIFFERKRIKDFFFFVISSPGAKYTVYDASDVSESTDV